MTAPDTPAKAQSMSEAILKATNRTPAHVADRWTGKIACIRREIPCAYPVAHPTSLNPKDVAMKYDMGFIPCTGAICGLWNPDKKECFELSALRAKVETRDLIEQIDGYLRMPKESA